MLAERVPVTVAELVAAVREQQVVVRDQVSQSQRATATTSTLVVVAAHPGAGATVLAVAIADATSRMNGTVEPVHLMDLAPPGQSGMASAAECEIGSRYPGWRVGRRGAVTMLWPALVHGSPTTIADLSGLPDVDGGGALVLDPGRPWTDLVDPPNTIWELARQHRVVVVCRATVPGVRCAELALTALDRPVTLAATGARRWPREVEASFGPRLTEVVGSERAVLIPAERSVEINGVDSDPLPKSIATAAARLVDLAGVTAPPRAHQRTKGLRR